MRFEAGSGLRSDFHCFISDCDFGPRELVNRTAKRIAAVSYPAKTARFAENNLEKIHGYFVNLIGDIKIK